MKKRGNSYWVLSLVALLAVSIFLAGFVSAGGKTPPILKVGYPTAVSPPYPNEAVHFVVILLVALVLEIFILQLFMNRYYKKKISFGKIVFAGIVTTALTLPYIFFIVEPYSTLYSTALIGEIAVIFIEALIYTKIFQKLAFKRALGISFVSVYLDKFKASFCFFI
jgi:hypothetical protein